MSPPAATVSAADVLIRTTAKIQDTAEPARHKPIIKLDPKHQQELVMGQPQPADRLRASLDSGRDNPFRPDGEIYKLTNPIVDYYKFGPNQSRSATPTYAELDYFSSKNRRKRRAEKRAELLSEGRAMPCWRRWFCCCCPKRRKRGQAADRPAEVGGESAPKPTTASNGGDGAQMLAVDGPATSGNDLNQNDQFQANVSRQRTTAKATGNNRTQPTKKVQLDGETTTTTNLKTAGRSNGTAGPLDEARTRTAKSCDLHSPQANEGPETEPKTTKVKTVRTSRCVIS